MSEAFVGEIRMFAGSYAPVNWHMCDGTLLPIAGYEVLFALLGTMYGGDGVRTFGLPDLRGRVPIHQGTGPGLSPYVPGQVGGLEAVTLGAAQMAAHTHAAQGSSSAGTATAPAGKVWAANGSVKQFDAAAGITGAMAGASVGSTGGGLPHENMAPFVAVNFIISLQGFFPSPN
jgi:microcystin-dependent protein